MALSLKIQKEIENDVHEQLYTNIFILTLQYPTTKEFNACFKKDMFVKNNKTAYLQVVYFLLNILDPTFFKQRNVWPILDIKMETQFRNELMKYINELNSTNKETGIPLLMTSHLISPGGYRFAEFIFRLSQFVLSEHIKRDTDNHLIPFPPKANSNYASEQVKNMEKLVDDQYNNLVEKQKIFEQKQNMARDNILYINSQQPLIEQSTKEIEHKIDEYIKENENQIASAIKTLPQREGLIDGKLKILKKDSNCFEKCTTLIDIISENKNIVNCNIEISNSSRNSNNSNNYVNLIEYYEVLLETIKNNKYIIKTRKDPNLPEYIQSSSEILQDLTEHSEKYEELVTDLELCITHLQDNTYERSTLQKLEALSQKIRELFDTIPTTHFPILV